MQGMTLYSLVYDTWCKSDYPVVDILKVLYTSRTATFFVPLRGLLNENVEILIALEFEALEKSPLSTYSDDVIGKEIGRGDLVALLQDYVLPDIQSTHGYQLIRENWLRYKLYEKLGFAERAGFTKHGHVKKATVPQRPFSMLEINLWIEDGDAGIGMTPDARRRLT